MPDELKTAVDNFVRVHEAFQCGASVTLTHFIYLDGTPQPTMVCILTKGHRGLHVDSSMYSFGEESV